MPATPLSSGSELPAFSVRVVQLFLALAAIFIPFVSLAKQGLDPVTVSPPAFYLSLSALATGLLAASRFGGVWVRRHLLSLVAGYVALVLTWLTVLLVLNQFDAEISGGYLMVIVAAGAMVAAGYDGVAAAAGLTALALLGVGVAGALVPDPVSNPWILMIYVTATGIVQVAASNVQSQLNASLQESRALYAEAEAAGGIGSWSLDLGTGESRWSDGMCALVGIPPPLGTTPAPALDDYMHPEDLPGAHAAFGAVLRGDLDEHAVSVRITTAGGRERVLGGVIRAERDAAGQVVRIVGVATDVTAQATHQSELVEALDRAEDAARLKEAILANMSHEIRTPLTAVIGYAELLAEVADAEMVPLVQPIVGGGQRLLDTLNSVLDLARLEAEGASLQLQPTDLVAVTEAARVVHAEAAEAVGLALCVEADPDVWAVADAAALGRVLDNLLSNAIRFTAQGTVTLRASVRADGVVLEVVDTGRGMSTGFTSRAAEAFLQESAGDARSHEGSGLGLSIVERLVEAMRGQLQIESAPGAGTRVLVLLPRATAEAIAAPQPDRNVWIARRQLAPIAAVQAQA